MNGFSSPKYYFTFLIPELLLFSADRRLFSKVTVYSSMLITLRVAPFRTIGNFFWDHCAQRHQWMEIGKWLTDLSYKDEISHKWEP